MAEAPITELVLSPRWAVSVGDIDGTPHVVLRIQHPRLGPLDFLLPDNDAVELAAALEKTWERRDERRLRGPGGAPGEIEPGRLVRVGRAPSWWSWLTRADPRAALRITAADGTAEDQKSKEPD